MVTALPKREELAPEQTWNLAAIYPTNERWEADFQQVESSLVALEPLRGTLGRSGTDLLRALRLRDETSTTLEALHAYAFMRRDENTTNPTYQALGERVVSLVARYGAATAFYAPEILELADEQFESMMRDTPGLSTYDFYLRDLRRQRAHIRSAEVEAVLAQAGEVTRAPSKIFGMINDADLKFPTINDEHGNPVELTKGRYTLFLESKDRRVRQAAFDAMYTTYGNLRNTFGATLSSSVLRDVFDARVRGYTSAVEAALDPDSIPLSVYTNLIDAVNRRLDLLHRYTRIRKRVLGLDDLHLYDMYVPLTPGKPREVSYDEARQFVLAGLSPLGEQYTAGLQRGMYHDRWIDVPENEGKRGGAYSFGAYSTQPFILLNWQNNINNVYTLAHELGHSMHSYFTRRTQPYIYGSYTIFVAEVASTCNEALLSAHLLKTTADPDLKLQVLNQQIEEFRATLFRQTMFAEFELEIHRRAEAGEALTTDLLSNIYRDLVVRYHGPAVTIDDHIALEWSRIPHFYNAFYVYKYATGISAATALSRQILGEGQPAVDRYLRLLQSGSSTTSIDLLRRAGVDMTTAEPVDQALQVFSDLLDQFENVVNAASNGSH
ncbi:MAG: oligoendopeptidase F [Herpetosiphon sp.]